MSDGASFSMTLNRQLTQKRRCYFPKDILKWILFNENIWMLVEMPWTFVPGGSINTRLAPSHYLDHSSPNCRLACEMG